jgi:hypothetical protein
MLLLLARALPSQHEEAATVQQVVEPPEWMH